MEAATTFAIVGETMDFTLRRISEGHSTPPALFVEIIVEKCHLINYHFLRAKNHLRETMVRRNRRDIPHLLPYL